MEVCLALSVTGTSIPSSKLGPASQNTFSSNGQAHLINSFLLRSTPTVPITLQKLSRLVSKRTANESSPSPILGITEQFSAIVHKKMHAASSLSHTLSSIECCLRLANAKATSARSRTKHK